MKPDAATFASWRSRIFLAAWTLYAGYYICRKDIAPSTDAGTTHLAINLACFGAAYAVGQVVGGVLADRFGARRTALAGAGISVLCTSLLAWHAQPAIGLALVL